MDLLKQTVEYQNWGTNAATFSFLATVFFTILQGWALFEQNKTIRRRKSGESVSLIFFIYAFCYFATFLVYGTTKMSITMTFNGLLMIPYLPILIGLCRFKGFSKSDWTLLILFSGMIAIVQILNHSSVQDVFVLAGLFGLLVPALFQIKEMLKTKSPGSIEPKFIISFMLAGIFWFIYGLTSGNWIFVVFNPISFTILVIILLLYLKYKRSYAAL